MKNKKKFIFGFIGIALLVAIICLFLFNNNKTTEYTVEFDTDGGSHISSQIIEKGGLVTKPKVPKKTGYDFVEWDYNDEKYDFNTKVTKNMTLVAIWEKVTTHQVLLEVDGKTKTIEVNENKMIDFDDLRDFEQEGFTVEWYLNGEKVDLEKAIKDFKEPEHRKTLFAKLDKLNNTFEYKAKNSKIAIKISYLNIFLLVFSTATLA